MRLLTLLSLFVLGCTGPDFVDKDTELPPNNPSDYVVDTTHTGDSGDTGIDVFNPTWTACANQIGWHPCDFILTDQNWEEFQFYVNENRGKVIVVDISAMWCGPCQTAARDIKNTVAKFGADDVLYITLLIEDTASNSAVKEDAAYWAHIFEIPNTAPVLAGDRSLLNGGSDTWKLSSWPTYYFIDRDMLVRSFLPGYNAETIEDRIIELL